MEALRQVRVQLLDAKTGQPIESVNTKTAADAVYMPDGSTLESYLLAAEEQRTEFQTKLAAHLAALHVDPAKIAKLLVGAPEYNKENGTFTYTLHDGSVKEIDTLLEKIPVKFDLKEEEVPDESAEVAEGDEVPTVTKNFLVMTADDGTEQKLDVTKLLNVYKGSNGDQIIVAVNAAGEIAASIVPKSINLADLSDEVIEAIGEEYVLKAATTTALGGVVVGAGLNVTADGTISTTNVKYDDGAVSLNFVKEETTAVVAVEGPADSIVTTTEGTAVSAQTVVATITGDASAEATPTYQWYKRLIGTDVSFTAIPGATAATLAGADIDVSAAGTTIYYCCVGATGEGVVADAVSSKRVTVVVNAAE
ncbi:MAG: hypothetical protein NC548_62565 [Lachnospiraceae bacterium]|nr:hypothetical protein [Lachnospiraceae bacterium]